MQKFENSARYFRQSKNLQTLSLCTVYGCFSFFCCQRQDSNINDLYVSIYYIDATANPVAHCIIR